MRWFTFFLLFVLICVIGFLKFFTKTDDDELLFVVIVARHGDRVPTFNRTYTNDPNFEATFEKYAPGELTESGINRMDDIGSYLQRRYRHFLKDEVPQETITTLSSNAPRNIESLKSVLRGWFPDENIDTWKPPSLDYIPYKDDDMLMFGVKCSDYFEYIKMIHETTKEVMDFNELHREDFKYLSTYTGDNITCVLDSNELYFTLKIQESLGLPLPTWTNKIYPDMLMEISKIYWKAFVSHPQSIKYGSGKILKQTTYLFQNKMTTNSSLKLNLIMGHDYNIAALLEAYEIYNDNFVPFGAYIIYELRKINGNIIVKTFYQDHSRYKPKLLKTKCGIKCPINTFINISSQYFPNPNVCLDKNSLKEMFPQKYTK